MKPSIQFGVTSLIIYFTAVSAPFSDTLSGLLIILSFILALMGVVWSARSLLKHTNKTACVGLIVNSIAIVIILGIMVYGHFILYGKVGILNLNI